MKDLIARIAVRLKGRSLRDYAGPSAPDGTPSWWEDFERAFRRHAARAMREQNPLRRAVARHARPRCAASPDSPREEVR